MTTFLAIEASWPARTSQAVTTVSLSIPGMPSGSRGAAPVATMTTSGLQFVDEFRGDLLAQLHLYARLLRLGGQVLDELADLLHEGGEHWRD